jgi:proton glutamate symport protein
MEAATLRQQRIPAIYVIARLRRITLSQWILLAMVAGILVGWLWPETGKHLKIASTVFLHLIKCIVVPLIFSTLVVGIAGHADDLKAVGRLAIKSLIYFEVITTLALFIGLGAVNLVRPGAGVQLPTTSEPAKQLAATHVTFESFVEHIFPQSFFDSAARNDVLQVVIYAILFGIALARVRGKPRETMLNFFEGLADVMFKFTGLVMTLAPIGVGAAMAYTIGQNGLGVLLGLGKLVATLYGALLAFIVLVFIPVMLLTRIPVRQFFRTVKEPALLAFSTASSEAALPDALRLMEKFGVPRRIVAFVLPAGYSFNLDGSTLYLSLAAVFVAQAAGVQMTFSQQLLMLLTLMLTSKGVAAVPRASLVILSGTLTTFHLPLEGVALILGVDAFLDMARTSVNLIGNCLASAVIARWEGELKVGERGIAPGLAADVRVPDDRRREETKTAYD